MKSENHSNAAKPAANPTPTGILSGKSIAIRPAGKDDAFFIARNILSAAGFYGSKAIPADKMSDVFTEICGMEDTLYSWKRTTIVCVDGSSAGSLTAYDGALYKDLKKKTSDLIRKHVYSDVCSGNGDDASENDLTYDFFANWKDETRPGEYYLDSLTILPEYRYHRLGKILVDHALEVAQGLGFNLVSLIVSENKIWLREYYSSCGFHPEGHLMFFGDTYMRMVQEL